MERTYETALRGGNLLGVRAVLVRKDALDQRAPQCNLDQRAQTLFARRWVEKELWQGRQHATKIAYSLRASGRYGVEATPTLFANPPAARA